MSKTEIIRKPLMSGHCAGRGFGSDSALASHERCHYQGGGQRANPDKQFQPCPCICHFVNDEGVLETYECGGCGRDVVAAPLWPLNFDDDPQGEVRYTHVDETGRALGEECQSTPKVSRNVEPEPDPDCIRCGQPVTVVDSRVCKACIRDDEREAKAAAKAEANDFDRLMAELEDDLAEA